MHRYISLLVVLVALQWSFPTVVLSDTFGTGDDQFEIEFVAIGDPGNPADVLPGQIQFGSVDYSYRMGKYEVSESMIRKAMRSSANDPLPLDITLDERGPDKPATRVSWLEAARFVNWLNTSKGFSPAYKFRESNHQPPPPMDGFELWLPEDPGYDAENPYRNRLARYVLPGVDEWHKAAFYDPVNDEYVEFATESGEEPLPVASGTMANTAVYLRQSGPADVTLAGGPSHFGTVGQGGNVWELLEDSQDRLFGNNAVAGERRIIRGGSWGAGGTVSLESGSWGASGIEGLSTSLGFRVASVPEPKSIQSLFILLCCLVRSGAGKELRL